MIRAGDYVRCMESHWAGIRPNQVCRVVGTADRGNWLKIANDRSIHGFSWCNARYFRLTARPVAG